jgi:hypothetical protein
VSGMREEYMLEQEGKSDEVNFVMMVAEFKTHRVIYGISCCLKLTNKQSMRLQSLPSCLLEVPSSFSPTHPLSLSQKVSHVICVFCVYT